MSFHKPFDEREMHMNKKLIYLVSCAALLAAALVLSVFIVKKNDIEAEDDCRYPYSFNMAENALTVTINGPFEKGYQWESETGEEEHLRLVSSRQSEKKAVFSFAAEKEGVESIAFLLRSKSFRDECIFRINVDAEILGNGVITILGSSHVDSLDSMTEGGSAPHPFFFISDESNRFSVMIAGAKAEDLLISCDAYLRGEAQDADDGKAMASFSPAPGCVSGVYNASVSTADGSMTIKISLYADAYSILLLDHEVITSASASGNASGNASGDAA